MKKFLAVAVLMLSCMLGSSLAQTPGTTWANTQVTLTTQSVNDGANFYLNTHNIGRDICITFNLDPTSYNLVGNPEVIGTYNVRSFQTGDIYVGRYQRSVSSQAWHVYVTFHWAEGLCQ